MVYQDKELQCKECGSTFVFSAGEQEFFAEKGFQNDPSRCPSCRANRKKQNSGGSAGRPRQSRELFTTTCSSCGAQTEVPFKPTGDRPVYCRDCFQAKKRF
ncbi:zinc-ribbon domain containing protein [Zhaonella formicivorans]|uniref:zinc-ribbon domain containing protein n=1 Tax=Zhaonella formicivorans TaxID=2528593 RepID=UPI0010F26763|nr:zinc-ribbon domain containing protein [Zhaonella formicivorans]